jgi:hypothetical protein
MHQKDGSSSSGATIVAIITALGLFCVIAFVVLGGLLFFGFSPVPTRQVVVQAAPTLPPPRSIGPVTEPAYVPAPSTSAYAPPTGTPAAGFTPAATPFGVYCDQDGQIRVDDQIVTLEQLSEAIDGRNTAALITLFVHPECPYGKAVEVEQYCRALPRVHFLHTRLWSEDEP